MEFVSSNNLGRLNAISDNCYFMIEADNPNFPLRGPLRHINQLLIYCSLYTLHSANVSDIGLLSSQLLIWAIAELHQISKHSFHFISLYWMLSSNWLWDTHWPRYVDTEDNWHFLTALELLLLDLSCCFNDIVDFTLGWLFFRFHHHIILKMTKLTSPDLLLLVLSLNFFYFTKHIVIGLTRLALDWIASR